MTVNLQKRKILLTLIISFSLLYGAAFWGYLGFTLYQNRMTAEQARAEATADLLASLEEVEQSTADDYRSKEEIIERFEPRFASLEERAFERLSNLYEEALEEYNNRRLTGNVDRMRLANEYLQQGQQLEKTFDSAFDTLLDEMEQMMEDNYIPRGDIEEVKKEVREMYEEMKQEKKQELLSEVRERL